MTQTTYDFYSKLKETPELPEYVPAVHEVQLPKHQYTPYDSTHSQDGDSLDKYTILGCNISEDSLNCVLSLR